jgi:hypothetical protein
MFLSIEPFMFNNHFLHFSDKTKNNVIENSWFHRIFYHHDSFSMNGVAIHFSINIDKTDTSYDKVKHLFKLEDISNRTVISELTRIEREVLNKIAPQNKTPVFHIDNQTKQGFIKLFNNVSKSHKEFHNNTTIHNVQPNHYTLKTHHIRRLNISQTQDFVLKISGVWENETSYGITYKFEKAGKSIHPL